MIKKHSFFKFMVIFIFCIMITIALFGENLNAAVKNDTITIPIPSKSNIRITGLTNSSWWKQRITVTPKGQPQIEWIGTGEQINKVIGQCVLPAKPEESSIEVAMSFDRGKGWESPEIQKHYFELPGLAGWVIGGQDAAGRPNGPAYWNTLVFIYWAKGY
jgi:hypothetical protein